MLMIEFRPKGVWRDQQLQNSWSPEGGAAVAVSVRTILGSIASAKLLSRVTMVLMTSWCSFVGLFSRGLVLEHYRERFQYVMVDEYRIPTIAVCLIHRWRTATSVWW